MQPTFDHQTNPRPNFFNVGTFKVHFKFTLIIHTFELSLIAKRHQKEEELQQFNI